VKVRRTIIAVLIVATTLLALKLFVIKSPTPARADELPDVIRLRGVIRDFRSGHADFNISDPSLFGHGVTNVDGDLPIEGRPIFVGSGLRVSEQWYDKSGNAIMPYVPNEDPGLPGGHFDVDVFDEATSRELYHKHKFDDAYDVTYVDLVNDSKLLLREVIPLGYPNELRLEFLNPDHGSGTFIFQADGPEITGSAREPFEVTFDPSSLVQLRVNFAWLLELRGTAPGKVQHDVADRDDAFAIRMYDVVSGDLVYELAVYHHGQEGDLDLPPTGGGEDSCGVSIDDDIGTFGATSNGAVSGADSFNQWYKDVMGTNLSKHHTIALHRDGQGIYEYLTDDFFPIDGTDAPAASSSSTAATTAGCSSTTSSCSTLAGSRRPRRSMSRSHGSISKRARTTGWSSSSPTAATVPPRRSACERTSRSRRTAGFR